MECAPIRVSPDDLVRFGYLLTLTGDLLTSIVGTTIDLVFERGQVCIEDEFVNTAEVFVALSPVFVHMLLVIGMWLILHLFGSLLGR